MITVVPVSTPHTAPLVIPTVAMDGVLLLQVPPPGVADCAIDAPIHTAVAPLIVGIGLIVTVTLPVIVLVQPVVMFFAMTV